MSIAPNAQKMLADFKRLEKALNKTPLPNGDGTSHTGKAADFMWMHQDTHGVHFKHIETRNYVTLKGDGTVELPSGDGPFQQRAFKILPEGTETSREANSANIINVPKETGEKPREIVTPERLKIERDFSAIKFDENQCGGAFDGNQVTSDADSGL